MSDSAVPCFGCGRKLEGHEPDPSVAVFCSGCVEAVKAGNLPPESWAGQATFIRQPPPGPTCRGCGLILDSDREYCYGCRPWLCACGAQLRDDQVERIGDVSLNPAWARLVCGEYVHQVEKNGVPGICSGPVERKGR